MGRQGRVVVVQKQANPPERQSVVWDVKTAKEMAHVPAMIVQQILHHHFGPETEAMTTWQRGNDAVLRISPQRRRCW